ncbi:MFS transporter [uncultured Stenotrophomonas sp.]|uniref:MFS transporter n=1 Tax=uncultured Stenotrophomonas sp. TaxID=165438 RepID=UPI0025D334BC|nr:MFS transporter [uncultured Stenotrophomonas sp.]
MSDAQPEAGPVADNEQSSATSWAGVASIAFAVSLIVTTELLPVSLLTQMADDLKVTSGAAGQSISVTALIAAVAGIAVPKLTAGFDRRSVSIALSMLLAVSSLIVAAAPSYWVLIAGRLLLGVSLGGFWAMAVALVMRIATPDVLPKALSIVFSGISVAMVVAAPVGSLLGDSLGWRGVFLLTGVLAGLSALAQRSALPRMPAAQSNLAAGWSLKLPHRSGAVAAFLCMFLVFAGHFSAFTYVRPLFENALEMSGTQFSAVLLAFGAANFVGTAIAGKIIGRSLQLALLVGPMAICVALVGMLLALSVGPVVVAFTIAWGLAFGIVPVGWSTWLARTYPADAERAGGVQVAAIQVANASGAAAGGLALNTLGVVSPFVVAAVLFAITSLVVAVCRRSWTAGQ